MHGEVARTFWGCKSWKARNIELLHNVVYNLERKMNLLIWHKNTKLKTIFMCLVAVWSLSRVCLFQDFSVHGISQARILEWVATFFSRLSSWPRDQTNISCISCIGRQILLPLCHLGSLHVCLLIYNLFILPFWSLRLRRGCQMRNSIWSDSLNILILGQTPVYFRLTAGTCGLQWNSLWHW